ncbi:MAG: NAD(P)H-hydrate dehydratase [Gammaproteobacteria bacterium]|nr:MAG: NAD(P)H-hydrate dehydratase [Gammaproteobacteria bacterium]
MKITASNNSLYSTAQVFALDAAAISSGIPGIQLMKRAGRAAFELLLKHYPAPELITVYCGSGKNGGDGYVLAALAAQRLIPVQVIQLTPGDKLSGEARTAYEFAVQERVTIVPWAQAQAPAAGVIVDCLLGIGLEGDVRPEFEAAIKQINVSHLSVLAMDIPSGLNGDTGAIHGAVVRAHLTVTFIGLKRGLVTGRGPAMCGEVFLSDLDIPADIFSRETATAEQLHLIDLLELLPQREADSHKGDFGHVLIIGGDKGYGGAVIMAAEAAARGGAGLVSVATQPEHVSAILTRCPEIMARGVASGLELETLLNRPTVIVIGPGLGRSAWSEQMLQRALQCNVPLVLDADALNILAEGRVVPDLKPRSNWLFTPHPGEAGRLLGITTQTVNADRFASLANLQQKFGGAAILKGAGSLVSGESGIVGVVTDGNPGMATGGMGDVLSGILGALIAQGLSVEEAARLGATLHASAADQAAEKIGQRGLLATDIIPYVSQLLE